eukprot:3961377-Ditylum_brightwellii.AAC.2
MMTSHGEATLYGLKRSPRNWYDLAKKTLVAIRLQQNKKSPCIFHGQLLPDLPPIYISLYVDGIIFFSKSPEVEEEFKTPFGQQVPCEFNGQISDYLGLKFTCRWNKGDLSIYVNQPGFVENFLQISDLNGNNVHPTPSPYRPGYPVGSILKETYPLHMQAKLTLKMQIWWDALTGWLYLQDQT